MNKPCRKKEWYINYDIRKIKRPRTCLVAILKNSFQFFKTKNTFFLGKKNEWLQNFLKTIFRKFFPKHRVFIEHKKQKKIKFSYFCYCAQNTKTKNKKTLMQKSFCVSTLCWAHHHFLAILSQIETIVEN